MRSRPNANSSFSSLGLLAGNPEAANGYTFLIMFLPYLSSAFVPTDSMPSWLQAVARNQPITPVIETVRGLLTDRPIGNQAGLAAGRGPSRTGRGGGEGHPRRPPPPVPP